MACVDYEANPYDQHDRNSNQAYRCWSLGYDLAALNWADPDEDEKAWIEETCTRYHAARVPINF
jgi:hypothetical protein